LLYAFSYNAGQSTVSLLDTNGSSKWQISTPGGDMTNGNMIKYKQIDAATDMVIATSGKTYINYNRIISSSSSPYSVNTVSSKTYRDSTASNRRLFSLYIIDFDNSVSLIRIGGTDTYLATIKF
jgi:hypothetical protein